MPESFRFCNNDSASLRLRTDVARRPAYRHSRTMRYLAVLLLVACGPRLETVGDACFYLAESACDRLTQCHAITVTTDTCTANSARLCCAEVDCSRPLSDAAKTQRCGVAFNHQSCGDAIANLVPAECR